MRLPLLTILLVFIVEIHSIPLHQVADDSANIVSKILGSFQGTSSMNLTHFFTSFDLPSCLRRCMPNSMDNVASLLESSKNPEAMRIMCQNLTESSKCASVAGCDPIFVGAISNAFQFICMDNIDKISSQMACIQDSAGYLQEDCESECAVQSEMLEKASKKERIDELFDMGRMCNSTSCLVDCYQKNLPKYCEIDEKNNFLDLIFSQFESLDHQPGVLGFLKNSPKSEDSKKKNGISRLFGLMLPDGCDDQKLKIPKIPKKIEIDYPKSVGSPKAKEVVPKSVEIETKKNSNLLEKSANLSSAALMINGKIQTLECQMLDSKGNSMKTPDFEKIYHILKEHFGKNGTAPKEKEEKSTPENSIRACREAPTKKIEKSAEKNSQNIPFPFFSIIFCIMFPILSRFL